MKNNSPTAAGQTKQPSTQAASDTSAMQSSAKQALIDAINQTVALFKLNYHNQFLKAFANEADVIAVKRLWFESLQSYSPEVVLLAAKAIVKTSEYLPTLKSLLSHCERIANRDLPTAHSAYAEACCASSPKVEQNWSHPAVYLTGKKVGWHFLQTHSEHMAFPVFKETYAQFCERARSGELLELPEVPKLEQKKSQPASKETSRKYMSSLKSFLDQ